MRIPGTRILTRSAAALLTVLAVGACGSSATTSSRSAAASASPTSSSSASTSASTSTSTTTSTTTTTAASGPLPCRASDLALTFLGGQGATGHGDLGFALRNTRSTSCATGGYPGVQFLSSSGAKLPTTPTHTTEDFFGPAPLHALVVGPGQSVSFRLGVSHGSASTTACTTAGAVQVIPPNDTATLSASITNGAYECGGAVTVTPLQPGTTAYHGEGSG